MNLTDSFHMRNVKELFVAIGKEIPMPAFCPEHIEKEITAEGLCEICGDDFLWNLSFDEIQKRIEKVFLIHRPANSSFTDDSEQKICIECGQLFPCSTVEALDGVPLRAENAEIEF